MAIFLLVIFIFSSNGHWILNCINDFQMKEKVDRMKRENVDETDLQQFIFSEKEFSSIDFHDDGEEMELHGKMYDIVRIKHVSGKVVVHCLSDAKETYLKMIAKKQQQQRNIRLKNLVAKVYVSAKNIITIAEDNSGKKHSYFAFSCGHTCSISYDILKPPPEIA